MKNAMFGRKMQYLDEKCNIWMKNAIFGRKMQYLDVISSYRFNLILLQIFIADLI